MSALPFHRTILRTLMLALCWVGAGLRAQQSPNIVWIFSDDHTMNAIGAYGSRLAALNPTPNIDRLANEGILFERSYVENSICSPSRATLLTGKFSHQHGKRTNRGEFNHDQQQFQKLLQQHGYQTALIGKIHLTGKMQGFDHWEVLKNQGDYYQPEFFTEKSKRTGTVVEGYVTDVITEKSIDWMKNGRDPDKPFMLMVHHKGTHRNWKPALRHIGLYEDVTIPEPENLFDDFEGRGLQAKFATMTIKRHMHMEYDLEVRFDKEKARALEKREAQLARGRLPGGEGGAYGRMNDEQREVWDAVYDPRNEAYRALSPQGDDHVRWKYQRYVKDYLRTVRGVDESVGQILDYLRESGLDSNTIVMYSSDQGFYLGEHGWYDKRFMYEESFSTPLVARWPGVIKPASKTDKLVQNIDWAPTFLDLAGVPVPEDMQGVSLVPLLLGQDPSDWRSSLYYHYYEGPRGHRVALQEGVVTERYKLIRFYGDDLPGWRGERTEWFELYDREQDPFEMQSLYEHPDYAELAETLRSELLRLRDHYAVPPNKTFYDLKKK